jgi:hypothetical protein
MDMGIEMEIDSQNDEADHLPPQSFTATGQSGTTTAMKQGTDIDMDLDNPADKQPPSRPTATNTQFTSEDDNSPSSIGVQDSETHNLPSYPAAIHQTAGHAQQGRPSPSLQQQTFSIPGFSASPPRPIPTEEGRGVRYGGGGGVGGDEDSASRDPENLPARDAQDETDDGLGQGGKAPLSLVRRFYQG